jgi:hypothetical protein
MDATLRINDLDLACDSRKLLLIIEAAHENAQRHWQLSNLNEVQW